MIVAMTRTQREFRPGFRLSARDVLTLIVGAVLAACVGMVDRWLAVMVGFVVLHFFLFCNVLRMARPLELVWAGLFAVLAILAGVGVVQWPVALGVSLGVTVVVASIQMRRPSYHGVGWPRINPELPQWWERRSR
jgi:hypothetical protein